MPSARSVKGRSRNASRNASASHESARRIVLDRSLSQMRVTPGAVDQGLRQMRVTLRNQHLGAEGATRLEEAGALHGLPPKKTREAGAEGVTAGTMRLPEEVLVVPVVVMAPRRVMVPGEDRLSELQALRTLALGAGQSARLLPVVQGEMKEDGDSRVVVGQQRRQGNPRSLKPLPVDRHRKRRKNHQLEMMKMMDGQLQSIQSAVEPSSLAALGAAQLQEMTTGVAEEQEEQHRPGTLLLRAAAVATTAVGERREAQTNAQRHPGRKTRVKVDLIRPLLL